MSTNVHLTPELEAFAKGCVESGDYNNVSEVVRSAMRLLKAHEEQRQAFTRMLLDARASADIDGTVSMDETLAEARAEIAATGR